MIPVRSYTFYLILFLFQPTSVENEFYETNDFGNPTKYHVEFLGKFCQAFRALFIEIVVTITNIMSRLTTHTSMGRIQKYCELYWLSEGSDRKKWKGTSFSYEIIF